MRTYSEVVQYAQTPNLSKKQTKVGKNISLVIFGGKRIEGMHWRKNFAVKL